MTQNACPNCNGSGVSASPHSSIAGSNLCVMCNGTGRKDWTLTGGVGTLTVGGGAQRPDLLKGETLSGSIVFSAGDYGAGRHELRLAPDGFYVNGVKVEQGESEARAVYDAFKTWMDRADQFDARIMVRSRGR